MPLLALTSMVDFYFSDIFLLSPSAIGIILWAFAHIMPSQIRIIAFMHAIWLLFLFTDPFLSICIFLVGAILIWCFSPRRRSWWIFFVILSLYQGVWMAIQQITPRLTHLIGMGISMLVALHFQRFVSSGRSNMGRRRDFFSKRYHTE